MYFSWDELKKLGSFRYDGKEYPVAGHLNQASAKRAAESMARELGWKGNPTNSQT